MGTGDAIRGGVADLHDMPRLLRRVERALHAVQEHDARTAVQAETTAAAGAAAAAWLGPVDDAEYGLVRVRLARDGTELTVLLPPARLTAGRLRRVEADLRAALDAALAAGARRRRAATPEPAEPPPGLRVRAQWLREAVEGAHGRGRDRREQVEIRLTGRGGVEVVFDVRARLLEPHRLAACAEEAWAAAVRDLGERVQERLHAEDGG